MSIKIIKSENDLEKHFKDHDELLEEKRNECHEKIIKYLETCQETMTDEEHKQYLKLLDERDKYDGIFYGEFGISYGKIEMYWSHEGAVLQNVKFCPFCGIEFKVEVENK